MSAPGKQCLINKPACGRSAGNPVCPNCGMDERVMYLCHADREAAQERAELRYLRAHVKELEDRLSAPPSTACPEPPTPPKAVGEVLSTQKDKKSEIIEENISLRHQGKEDGFPKYSFISKGESENFAHLFPEKYAKDMVCLDGRRYILGRYVCHRDRGFNMYSDDKNHGYDMVDVLGFFDKERSTFGEMWQIRLPNLEELTQIQGLMRDSKGQKEAVHPGNTWHDIQGGQSGKIGTRSQRGNVFYRFVIERL